MKTALVALALAFGFAGPAAAATLYAGGGAGLCGEGEISWTASTNEVIQNACSATDGAAGVWISHMSYAARASFGSIGTSASAAGGAIFTDGFGYSAPAAEAWAKASDSIWVDLAGGYLSIPVDIAGTLHGSLTTPTDSLAGFGTVLLETSVWLLAYGAEPMTIFSYVYQWGGDAPATQGSTGVTNVLVPIIDGFASFEIGMMSRAICSTGNNAGDACSQSADFLSSARLLGATVLDAEFNPVLNVTLTSESGFDYLAGVEPHISPVPLPASLPLLGAALAALLGLRRGRRLTSG